jgi:hypothetical protein
MKQKGLTLKLTLAIVALTSLSAATSLIVPTYATTTTTTTTTDDGSDTTTTTGLADIVNRTTTMIPSEEDIGDLVTGAITDALQQNIQIV